MKVTSLEINITGEKASSIRLLNLNCKQFQILFQYQLDLAENS